MLSEIAYSIKYLTSKYTIPVTIKHLVTYDGNKLHGAEIITDIFPLIALDNYSLFIRDSSKDDIVETNYVQQYNRIIVSHRDKVNTYRNDIYEAISDKSLLKYTLGDKTNEYYEFMLSHFESITKERNVSIVGNPAGTSNAKTLYEQITRVSKWYLENENEHDQLFIVPNFCYQMLPYKILVDLATESGFFEIEDHNLRELAILLKDVYIARTELFRSTKQNKYMIFSQSGLEAFVKNGRLSDHVAGFKSLTPKQVNEVIQSMLDLMRVNNTVNVFILKKDLTIASTEMVLFRDKCCYMFNAEKGYMQQPEYYIELSPLIETVEDFILNHLIPYHTLSKEDTREYLSQLMLSIS